MAEKVWAHADTATVRRLCNRRTDDFLGYRNQECRTFCSVCVVFFCSIAFLCFFVYFCMLNGWWMRMAQHERKQRGWQRSGLNEIEWYFNLGVWCFSVTRKKLPAMFKMRWTCGDVYRFVVRCWICCINLSGYFDSTEVGCSFRCVGFSIFIWKGWQRTESRGWLFLSLKINLRFFVRLVTDMWFSSRFHVISLQALFLRLTDSKCPNDVALWFRPRHKKRSGVSVVRSVFASRIMYIRFFALRTERPHRKRGLVSVVGHQWSLTVESLHVHLRSLCKKAT